jgi:S-DNA-T family DNA segregation ATPase FtsK/SpoIIIE
MEKMRQCWTGPLPPAVPMLPDVVTLETLFQLEDLTWDVSPAPMLTSVPVGLTALDVLPFAMDLQDGPHFLVSGGYASGKSTFLRSWLLSLAAHVPPQKLRVVLVDFGHGPLQTLESLPHVSHFVSDDMKLGDVLSELQEEQNRWKHWKASEEKSRAGESCPTQWLIVLDDLESFLQQAGILAKGKLQELLKKGRSGGLFMVTAGNTGDFSSNSFDPLVKTLTGNKTGVLLGTREDQGLFGSLRLLGDQAPLRAGDGYFFKRGQLEGRFRGATPDKGVFSLFDWIEQITWKTASEVRS